MYQFFDVDINEYLDIFKGVGAQIVIWAFYYQMVKVEEFWVEQEFVLLIVATLKREAGSQNVYISYRIPPKFYPIFKTCFTFLPLSYI